MIELIRRGKDTISLHGCSVVKPHYYETNKQINNRKDLENTAIECFAWKI
jgi:coenzyme F420-reducing hydrogenase delta subunit